MEGNRAKVLYPQIVIFQYAPVDVLFDSCVLKLLCRLFLVFLSISCFLLLAANCICALCCGTGSTCVMQIARFWPSKPLCSQ